MKIIKNKIMANLLKKLREYKSPRKSINIELNDFFANIYPDIILHNGIITRKKYKGKKIDKEYIIKSFGSISAYEDYEFHTHVVDIVDCSLMQSLKFGLIIKDIIKTKLKHDFPKEKFIVVLACDGKNKLNTIIRFHKLRKDEIVYDQKMIDRFDHPKLSCGFLVEEV